MSLRSVSIALLCLVALGAPASRPATAGTEEPPAAAANPNRSDSPETAPVIDEVPTPTRTVPPVYPESARKRGQGGMVSVQAYVNRNGKVQKARIAEGKGVAPDLDRAALDAVRKWEFRPARLKGKPIATWVVIPVNFKLH